MRIDMAIATAAIGLAASVARADSSSAPIITEAHADPASTVLHITGGNFGRANPTVTLGSFAKPLAVTNVTATQIDALLPPGISPGTYLLTVTPARRGDDKDDA